MPYVKEEDRGDVFKAGNYENPGNLNYTFTEIINQYIVEKKLSYQTINDIIGALEGAKLEFYARIVRPYEDQKIKENGDVY